MTGFAPLPLGIVIVLILLAWVAGVLFGALSVMP
jgi:hypothetical protein